jgi:hypothetical protein
MIPYNTAQMTTMLRTILAMALLIGNMNSTRPAKKRNTAACNKVGIPSTTAVSPKLSIPS